MGKDKKILKDIINYMYLNFTCNYFKFNLNKFLNYF